ncbi:Putative uncharacterized protein [Moritella viscosa]|uniref:delta-class carbonic anhydrase n=1 Tax=Moritella viscosa TaxID=80854 RepID=UPI0009129CAD|nr:delta-class carbonic anhydrase [Moritella viscosa]SGZ08784.1 Putative uncharacterized protein [Moritella viscosa]
MNNKILVLYTIASLAPFFANAGNDQSIISHISDKQIQEQRTTLAANTQGKGFGPQSPRDIDLIKGRNKQVFSQAPEYTKMNLCNIHVHKNAEHKGGEFTQYAGNGDGQGYQSGYKYSGILTQQELSPLKYEVGASQHGSLYPGDTIEAHYVYSTAQVNPGPTLSSCFSDTNKNPQLRVETQVYVLVNDPKATNFIKLTKLGMTNGVNQAVNIPSNTGIPVQYAGSTTGPSYNEIGSPFQVSWSVRPQVMKVSINSVGKWLKNNIFDEHYAHGVRNLVNNPDLLSDH